MKNVLALAACVSLVGACAGRIPLPEHLRAADSAALLTRMSAAAAKSRAFVTDVRLSVGAQGGQARVVATLAVQRPDRLRYEVRSPFGTTLHLFATNGRELSIVDMEHERYLYGPARPENLDRLLGLIPLGLTPAGWVSLFFGEMQIPASANLTYDDMLGRFVLTFPKGDGVMRCEVDPETARLRRATLRRDDAKGGTEILADFDILERDSDGLPKRLRIAAPAAKATLEATLTDVTLDPETFSDTTFVLDPPAGFALERLD